MELTTRQAIEVIHVVLAKKKVRSFCNPHFHIYFDFYKVDFSAPDNPSLSTEPRWRPVWHISRDQR